MITKWTSSVTNHDVTIHVRDDFMPGDRCSHYSWSSDGNRWYASEYLSAIETAALGHGCISGVATVAVDMDPINGGAA